MFRKSKIVLSMLTLLGAVSLSNATWNSQGNIAGIFIGEPNTYVNTNPSCVVLLTDGLYSAFTINTDAGKAMLSEILTARANGAYVQIDHNGTLTGPSSQSWGKAVKIWIQ